MTFEEIKEAFPLGTEIIIVNVPDAHNYHMLYYCVGQIFKIIDHEQGFDCGPRLIVRHEGDRVWVLPAWAKMVSYEDIFRRKRDENLKNIFT